MMRTIAAKLPSQLQQELKRLHFRRQIRQGRFLGAEPEYDQLAEWVEPGDWVIDVGANVGQYTLRLSELVGAQGRVIAFEPIPATFEVLAANVTASKSQNVTLINAAVSKATSLANMTVPKFDSGLDNYYEAHLDDSRPGLSVLCLAVDSLNLETAVKLIKIDAEGHEPVVLQGMLKLIERDRPILIVEGVSDEVARCLEPFGYAPQRLTSSSPNTVFMPTR